MSDISGFGSQVRIVASTTFPAGFTVTQGADDADFFDVPSQQVADKAMGVNGDLLTWSKATPINITLNVVPDGDDDENLSILLEANRVGRGKLSVRDQITMTITYPDGSLVTYTNGKITDGMTAKSVASAGRFKTRAYMFTFENRIGSF